MSNINFKAKQDVVWVNPNAKGQDFDGVVLAVIPEENALAVKWTGRRSGKTVLQVTPMEEVSLPVAEVPAEKTEK